ncbi:hypothetical protein ACGF0J_19325 [Nonomuraea sp. NPDC047897]|uniref:hypothetical protein n=1 Tax=Nonomuraea sp. NPDC047897 TaxID=3364346 RepID=UPI00370FE878
MSATVVIFAAGANAPTTGCWFVGTASRSQDMTALLYIGGDVPPIEPYDHGPTDLSANTTHHLIADMERLSGSPSFTGGAQRQAGRSRRSSPPPPTDP